jgi:hypothetical protein
MSIIKSLLFIIDSHCTNESAILAKTHRKLREEGGRGGGGLARPTSGRAASRHQPERHARSQRAAGAVAGARHGSLAKTDIARMTSLSAQTASVIMRELEEDGLLAARRTAARQDRPAIHARCRSIPTALFLGLKIGRRSAELVLIDFLGKVRAMRPTFLRYPTPDNTIGFVRGRSTLRAAN